MIFLAGIVLHSMLIAAPQRPVIEFRVTNAYVSYTAQETNMGSSVKTTIGRNDHLLIELLGSPEMQAKLVISASGFKTDRPMRDWTVKTLYLKSGQYPEITFEILKINGEPLSKVLRPVNQKMFMKISPQNTTVSMVLPDNKNAPMVLRIGGEELSVEGKLRDDILNAIYADKGEIHLTGKLTVAGGSKDFDTAVSFQKIGDNEFALSTVINAKFSDFGLSAPNLAWVIEVKNALVLKGHAVIQILK